MINKMMEVGVVKTVCTPPYVSQLFIRLQKLNILDCMVKGEGKAMPSTDRILFWRRHD